MERKGALLLSVGEEIKITARLKDAKDWVQEVKFSPAIEGEGLRVAVASHDQKIYIYDMTGKLLSTCSRNNSYITHLDWSTDGLHLQVNDGAYELLFFETATGRQIPQAKSLRDEEWATWTCTLNMPWEAYGHQGQTVPTSM